VILPVVRHVLLLVNAIAAPEKGIGAPKNSSSRRLRPGDHAGLKRAGILFRRFNSASSADQFRREVRNRTAVPM
jgi:hypothetical protein